MKTVPIRGTDREERRMAEVVKILGIAGSLRKGFYNRYAVSSPVKLVPPWHYTERSLISMAFHPS
jgi:hypothetical protein